MKIMKKHILGILIAALLGTVAGLGGTSGGALKDAAAADGHVTTCSGGSIYLNYSEMSTLNLHNQARAQNGLAKLCVDPTLTEAARAHSTEMLNRGFFSHNSHNGELYSSRLERFGYTPSRLVGENISWGSGGQGAADGIFDGWMSSSPHRANILSSSFQEIGVGTAYGAHWGYNDVTLYTVDLGTR